MAILTASGVTFSDGTTQSTASKCLMTSAGNITGSNNVSYQNTSGRIMMVSYAFYHPWRGSADTCYIQISPDNSTWYTPSHNAVLSCGQAQTDTISAMVPVGWFYRGYTNGGLSYAYNEY